MSRVLPLLLVLRSTLVLALLAGLAGCGLFSFTEVAHTRGARQHTATLELDVPPAKVYTAMLRVAESAPGWTIVNNDPVRMLMEAEEGKRSVAGQATELGSDSTFLFIWADAGYSGRSGRDLAIEAMRGICKELDVECKFRQR